MRALVAFPCILTPSWLTSFSGAPQASSTCCPKSGLALSLPALRLTGGAEALAGLRDPVPAQGGGAWPGTLTVRDTPSPPWPLRTLSPHLAFLLSWSCSSSISVAHTHTHKPPPSPLPPRCDGSTLPTSLLCPEVSDSQGMLSLEGSAVDCQLGLCRRRLGQGLRGAWAEGGGETCRQNPLQGGGRACFSRMLFLTPFLPPHCSGRTLEQHGLRRRRGKVGPWRLFPLSPLPSLHPPPLLTGPLALPSVPPSLGRSGGPSGETWA